MLWVNLHDIKLLTDDSAVPGWDARATGQEHLRSWTPNPGHDGLRCGLVGCPRTQSQYRRAQTKDAPRFPVPGQELQWRHLQEHGNPALLRCFRKWIWSSLTAFSCTATKRNRDLFGLVSYVTLKSNVKKMFDVAIDLIHFAQVEGQFCNFHLLHILWI